MCPYPRTGHTFVIRQARFIGKQGDGSTESRPHFIVRVARFKDAYYLTSSYTINHNPMLHYAGALSGQRTMATALVLEADGRRKNGRWAYGINNQNSDCSRGFEVSLAQAGVVLDFKPDLAARVIDGSLALDNV